MIAVILEAEAVPAQQERYLQLAAELRTELVNIAGFISIERFKSLSTEGKILSLSWWESDEAVAVWKNNMKHRAAQMEGRESIFSFYRIRVAHVLRDYSSE
ncbi:antibiotic biosynthesis monooxygenase family protein [Citrobacter farmeri]|uniref:antibiotic biosynthesis monooxygenase family protein n=1 Tax=Citrobacter farmeri TaxID=67824 RepID=UPI00189E7073|nr:antibiotic biosynthesis monooxygenase [Citrobacter farmeri]MDB2164082.1 antibiotic biosynthesis monooxygenase [Citrobacter farmeri]